MIFQYINVCPVPREMLKNEAVGLGFQHLLQDLANVNAWKTMFDPYIDTPHISFTQGNNFHDFQFAFLDNKTLPKWGQLLKERICS